MLQATCSTLSHMTATDLDLTENARILPPSSRTILGLQLENRILQAQMDAARGQRGIDAIESLLADPVTLHYALSTKAAMFERFVRAIEDRPGRLISDEEALDKIEQGMSGDSWWDDSHLMESVGTTLESTGRSVNWNG